MKIKITTCLFLIWILSSCSNNSEKSISVIKGKIPDFASTELQIHLKDSVYSTNIDNHGEFRLEISLNQPQYLFIKGLNRKFFILPNDSVYIEKSNHKYIFSGNQSALINNYYSDWYIYKESVTDTANFDYYYNQPPDKFVKLA